MVRDDLLEQIRQPLWDRIDRRMAVILAVSITAHLAIAIVGWLGDPVVRGWLPGDLPQPAFSAESLDMLPVPMPPDGDAAGVAVAVAPAPAAPKATAPKPGRTRPRDTAPKKIDPKALVSSLVGDEPSFRDSSRRIGRDLEDQIDTARDAARSARVGKDGAPDDEAIGNDDGPAVSDVDGPTSTRKTHEASRPYVVTPDPPPDGVPYDPTRDLPTKALQRCMESSSELAEGENAKLRIEFTIGETGVVTAATVGSERAHRGLAACVERRLEGWKFPVELPRPAVFKMSMMCIAR